MKGVATTGTLDVGVGLGGGVGLITRGSALGGPAPLAVATTAAPMAIAGLDLNRDGLADALVIRANRNRDGIPDVLQQGMMGGGVGGLVPRFG